jgi:signal transduction histidine kinase
VIARQEMPAAPTPSSPVAFHDDVIVEGTTRRVVDELNTFYSRERLHAAARESERHRLARELHDGVLQSLTGAALRLRALSNASVAWPDSVRTRLQDLEALIVEQQRELRGWIETLKPPTPAAMASCADMERALRALCDSTSQCGTPVRCIVPLAGAIPRYLGDQIYRLVQEGISNAVRHAEAKLIQVELHISPDRVRLVIADDGCGFPFQGSFDLKTLNARALGPASIRERVAVLQGGLMLLSTTGGSRLTITLPRARLAETTMGVPTRKPPLT